MALKGTEEFVANSLLKYFNKKLKIESVSFTEGQDPPDIYLNIDKKKIPVEITDIDENTINRRTNIDYGFLKFIHNLDKQFKSNIPKSTIIDITFYHNNKTVKKFDKPFRQFLSTLIKDDYFVISSTIEGDIANIGYKIEIKTSLDSSCISGSVESFGGTTLKNRNYLEVIDSTDLSLNSFNIVQERIFNKSKKCSHIQAPVWLALYENYYDTYTSFEADEHIKHYTQALEGIEVDFFDKVLIIFANEDVIELS